MTTEVTQVIYSHVRKQQNNRIPRCTLISTCATNYRYFIAQDYTDQVLKQELISMINCVAHCGHTWVS